MLFFSFLNRRAPLAVALAFALTARAQDVPDDTKLKSLSRWSLNELLYFFDVVVFAALLVWAMILMLSERKQHGVKGMIVVVVVVVIVNILVLFFKSALPSTTGL